MKNIERDGDRNRVLCCFSHVRLCATLWSLAHRLLCPWDSPGKNTGVGCHALLQGIFPTQGSNPGLTHCRWILYLLSHQGSPVAAAAAAAAAAKSLQSCLTLCDPVDCSPQAPLSMGFSRQEHWSGLPCPPLGDLHDPGIEDQGSNLCLLHWQVDSSPLSHQGNPKLIFFFSHVEALLLLFFL